MSFVIAKSLIAKAASLSLVFSRFHSRFIFDFHYPNSLSILLLVLIYYNS